MEGEEGRVEERGGEGMITPKVFLYSVWCSIFCMEVLVIMQFIMSLFLIQPELVVVMNRSPEWAQSVTPIIQMLTPDMFGTALLGVMTFALCLATFGSINRFEMGEMKNE